MSRPVLMVDGNSILHRAFHVSTEMTFQGEETGALLVFLRMLRAAADDLRPDQIWVAWDAGIPAFRKELLPEYKAKRIKKRQEATTEENARRVALENQREWLEERMLPLLGVAQWRVQDWEADDLVGFWCRYGKLRNGGVVYSGDKDLWQLVSTNINVFCPNRGLISLDNFEEVTDLESPRDWLAFRALTGDPSDGIPGVGGVGEVRGRKLVRECGGLFTNSARAAFGEEFVASRVEAYKRNLQIMALFHSAERLHKQMEEEPIPPTYRLPDLEAAERAAEGKALGSLVGRWVEWTEPFRNLKPPRNA